MLLLQTEEVLSPRNPPCHPQTGCCVAVGLEYGCTKYGVTSTPRPEFALNMMLYIHVYALWP